MIKPDNKNISKYMKFPKKISEKKMEDFFYKKGLGVINKRKRIKDKKVNEMLVSDPYPPTLEDQYRLYQFIILNKRTTILEFGSGWSTITFASALNELKKKYSIAINKLRRNNPFELFVLENEKKFFNITKRRTSKFFSNRKELPPKINYKFSEVEMTMFNNNFATQYKSLHLCNPDFIYLDGPDPWTVKGKINNITIKHKDMMPMACDIIKLENFYTPGTIIVVDGRGANAKFLKDNFKRNWLYRYECDQHIFYLNDPVLGKYNKLQLEFYKENIK